MFTPESLLEIHKRAHKSFEVLVLHCLNFSESEINKEFNEYGYSTIRLQLHHIIGAEMYWMGVLKGNINVEDDSPNYPTIDSLEKYRAKTFSVTQDYLLNMSQQELNTPKMLKTWGGNEYNLTPAIVVIRPIVHIFHHAGQISIMCKILKKPAPGFDFPIL